MSSWRSLFAPAILVCGSVLTTLLLFEFIVFRFVLQAPDIPQNAYIDGVIKFRPHQRGVRRNNPRLEWRINNAGWNSGHDAYTTARTLHKLRIAVVGDSYVDAEQVNFDESFAERLERKLGSERYEVYRFGIPGAPLSQYLHMLRQEVLAYAPDVVILLLIHNDFTESYKIKLGRYSESFLRFDVGANGRIIEIPPRPYRHPWWWPIIRGSATYRYLVDYRGIRLQPLRDLVNAARLGKEYQANIEVTGLMDRRQADETATSYVFGEFARLAKDRQVKLVLIMDGDRQSIYKSVKSKVLTLNRMAQDIARDFRLPFIDMHPIFQHDFAVRQQRFNGDSDNHWNEYGHELVAQTLFQFLMSGPNISAQAFEDVRDR